jgi:hypothetical protein
MSQTNEASADHLTVQDAGNERSFFTILPHIVLTLGLSPYALALYIHLKKVTGERAGAVCYKKTSTLAGELKMSAGSISAAKVELAAPRSHLNGKSLIAITQQKNHNGGKPRHHITITDIWAENFAVFGKSGAISPDERTSSHNEIANSYSEQAISPGEIKKNPSEEKPVKKNHTHLRVAGAPAGGVCVNPISTKAFERYGFNHPTQIRNPIGWASTARKTGEWDERVTLWCAEHGIDPVTGENIAAVGDKIEHPEIAPRKCPPECPHCFGTGWESIPGKGARKCPNLITPGQAAA